MAQPSSFVNTTRARITAILKSAEDAKALETEFNALGGVTFSNLFDFAGEGTPVSTYDMTQAEFNAALVVVGEFNTFMAGGAVSARATRAGDFYKAKV